MSWVFEEETGTGCWIALMFRLHTDNAGRSGNVPPFFKWWDVFRKSPVWSAETRPNESPPWTTCRGTWRTTPDMTAAATSATAFRPNTAFAHCRFPNRDWFFNNQTGAKKTRSCRGTVNGLNGCDSLQQARLIRISGLPPLVTSQEVPTTACYDVRHFGGIPIAKESLEERARGVWVVNINSGEIVGFVKFEDAVQEIFAVELLSIRNPDLINHDKEIIGRTYELPDSALADVPDHLKSPAT